MTEANVATPARRLRSSVVAILGFAIDEPALLKCAEALLCGGIQTIEVALRAESSLASLQRLSDEFGHDIQVGAGTVLTSEQAQAAIDAGASFVVSPGLRQEIVERCRARGVAAIPGVLTATEIMDALALGVAMVKVFPAGTLGPGYLRNLCGPFPNLQMLATGGISRDSVPDYLAAGANAVGLGRELFGDAASGVINPLALEARARALMESLYL